MDSTKLPYRSPELVVLGDVTSLTSGIHSDMDDYLGSGRHNAFPSTEEAPAEAPAEEPDTPAEGGE